MSSAQQVGRYVYDIFTPGNTTGSQSWPSYDTFNGVNGVTSNIHVRWEPIGYQFWVVC
jgi:hypothetical protein